MRLYIALAALLLPPPTQAQLFPSPNADGQISNTNELYSVQKLWIPMRDSTKLYTELYLPILSDSMVLNFPINDTIIQSRLIPLGANLVVYPTLNGAPNPFPQQVPLLFLQYPYGVNRTKMSVSASILCMLGYAVAIQESRGCYQSEGTFLPFSTGNWPKGAYHPDFDHSMDPFPSGSPSNGNHLEDVWDSYEWLQNSYTLTMDTDGDGVMDTTASKFNGSFGVLNSYFSTLWPTLLPLLHPIDGNGPGLKTWEGTGAAELYPQLFENGVYRQGVVERSFNSELPFWLPDSAAFSFAPANSSHSIADYWVNNLLEMSNLSLDHLLATKHDGVRSNYYPNSPGRADMDVSHAPLDGSGNADPLGTHSRYELVNTPGYFLTGWWDILCRGQIDSWGYSKALANPSVRNKQKLIIGPWSNMTLLQSEVGDVVYPNNVRILGGLNIDSLNLGYFDLNDVVKSENLSWLRYTLNRNSFANIGEPRYRIPQSQQWHTIEWDGSLTQARVPAHDVDYTYAQITNYFGGSDSLYNMPVGIDSGGIELVKRIALPRLNNPPIVLPPITDTVPVVDFAQVPAVRLYVVGPHDDGVQGNETVGNYWWAGDSFPVPHYENLFLHTSGQANTQAPLSNEGFRQYLNDPTEPAWSVGGSTLGMLTPDGNRPSVGQMDYNNGAVGPWCLSHPGVISFTTAAFTDTLCFIGRPKATIYAKAEIPGNTGPTDTDFFVKLLDVYPDGRQMFICEGACNARAREYARSIYNGQENDDAPFSNIQLDTTYEFQFNLQPMAYTFASGHRLKVLISSANYPHYRVNPNVPIEDGEFYRWQPEDSLFNHYNFQGQEYTYRKGFNYLAVSHLRPSRIELPLVGNGLQDALTSVEEVPEEQGLRLWPNPTSDMLFISAPGMGPYRMRLFNYLGDELQEQTGDSFFSIHTKDFPNGMYVVELLDLNSGRRESGVFIKINTQ